MKLSRLSPFLALALALGSPLAAETESYTDEQLGVSIRWPSDFHFSQDPQLLGQVLQESDEATPGVPLAARIGLQFIIFRHPPGAVEGFNPNLNLATEYLPEAIGEMTLERYAELSATNAPRILPGTRVVSGPSPTTIGGKTFHVMEYELSMSGSRLRSKGFLYYRPEQRMAFTFTLTDLATRADESFPELEAVARSVRVVDTP